MAIRRQLAQAIDLFRRGEELRSVQVPLFSGLSREEADALRDAWAEAPLSARALLVTRAAELAEDNVDLEFTLLARVATHDSEAAVRRQAAEALWESDDLAVAADLTRLLQGDPDDSVRAAAAGALRRFVLLRELERIPETAGDALVAALRAAAEDESESVDVRGRAIESLGARALPWVNTLIADAHYDDDPRLRVAALRAMGESADERWLDLLADEAESDDAELRFAATVSLGLIGSEQSLPALFGLLEDDDQQVALAAVAALAEVGTQDAEERLREIVEAGEEPLAEAAAAALDLLNEVDGEDEA
ncbi:MAG: HEAT repeat domain-containing protein [Dehalococcoidia bacterium]